MRHRLLALIIGLAAPCSCIEARSTTSPSRRADVPIVVLLHHSVWFSSVDLPWFILYEDGHAIFANARERGIPRSYSVTPSTVADPTALLSSLDIGEDFFRLDSSYDFAPNATDQETVFLYVWRQNTLKSVAVRAGLTGDRGLSDEVPAAFRRAFQKLTDFHPGNSKPWHPDSIEVAAWPYDYAPDNPPLPWPKSWPDLTSSGTTMNLDPVVDTMWIMRLSYDRLGRLDSLLSQRREKQAILISGHKLSVGYRLVFPGEKTWRQFFGHLEE